MGYSSMLPGLCKLGFASNSAKPFFGSLSGARLRANGIITDKPPNKKRGGRGPLFEKGRPGFEKAASI
ncbi:MAG: hypothetical protein CVU58_04740 [Deltaproteobacteria bacterium HGW-Deltaproteobacteria-16]|nr:MAG: hypothetical protein CVU58_04740 [Deltaproteobacteria bacterium HGW-Deltaproteobacteria-16]